MFQRNLPFFSFKISREKLSSFFRRSLKHFSIWAVALLSISLFFACSSQNEKSSASKVATAQENEKIRVLSTTSMIGDLVVQIGGDFIDHSTLICGDIDPHSYELVKGDDELFTSAQIVFCHGDNLEHGASLHSQIHSHPLAVRVNEIIGKKHPHLMITLPEGGVDPHVWLDASLWAEGIDPIADNLSSLMPDHETQIRANAKGLKEKILATDKAILEQFAMIEPSKKYLVSTHDAFRYFSRHYLTEKDGDFNQHAVAPEGVAPEGQIGFQQIKGMVEFVMDHKITYVFQESNLRPDSLKKICSVCASKGTEVKIYPEKLFADTTGPTPIGQDAYIAMMKNNAGALFTAWQSNPSLEK